MRRLDFLVQKEVPRMAKYLMMWELDLTKVPVNPKERATMWGPMIQMVKQQMAQGGTTEWGCFAGETRGFSIAEGDEMTVSNSVQKYLPYVTFTVHQIISVNQMEELIKNLQK